MFEADTLCDRVAVIAQGRIVAEGTPRRAETPRRRPDGLEVEVFGIEEQTLARLRALPGVTSVSVEERDQAQVLTIQSPHGLELDAQPLTGFLDGAQIGRIAAREPTLEDAYVALVTEAERSVSGYLRIVWVGLVLRMREFAVSRWFLLMASLQPVIFASIAFYLFKAGGRSGTLLYAALGAGMMGIWSIDPLRLGRGAAVEPLAGDARAARRARRRRSSSCCCRSRSRPRPRAPTR